MKRERDVVPSRRTPLLDINRHFYDPLWRDVSLVEPARFNTWPLVSSLVAPGQRRLEVAPGLRPRLPLEGTEFLDFSPSAVAKLRARGASAVVGLVSALPYPDSSFALVCAFDIVEHVDDDDATLAELARVSATNATLLLSVPLHPRHWNAFDDFVGHRRRYEPAALAAKLGRHDFVVERSAAYGMRPRASRIVDVGMWFLTHQRKRALWWYNRVFMPLGLRFQQSLVLVPGTIDAEAIDEVLLVCRKA